RSSVLAVAGSWVTSMREEAKCTLTVSTPSRRPTCFSILFTQDGQENPSARSVVVVVPVFVGAVMALSLRCATRVSDGDDFKVGRERTRLLDLRQVRFPSLEGGIGRRVQG